MKELGAKLDMSVGGEGSNICIKEQTKPGQFALLFSDLA